ncbi:DUF3040 domain-containing protein [Streptomyces sp. NPDC102395]|uniref:DUF3040 domain-containing protein n=1 Tax=Streptomyces sp. NPDC102395 TaxID=3366168 RepID=UPI0038107FF6
MATGRLSDDERRILAEMERALRRDRRLDRRLSTLHWRPGLSRMTSYTPHPLTVALLLAVSIGLMVTGVTTAQPPAIWAFAALWPLTLYALFRLAYRGAQT